MDGTAACYPAKRFCSQQHTVLAAAAHTSDSAGDNKAMRIKMVDMIAGYPRIVKPSWFTAQPTVTVHVMVHLRTVVDRLAELGLC